MTAYARADLPWSGSEEETRSFKKIVRISLALFFLLGLLIPMIHLPDIKKEKRNVLPPMTVQMLLQERVVVAKVTTPKKSVQRKSPKAIKSKAKKRAVKRHAKPVRQPIRTAQRPRQQAKVPSARQRAASVGLFADSSALQNVGRSQLRSLNSPQRLRHGGAGSRQGSNRGLLTASVGRGSGGMQNVAFSREVGGGTGLRDAGLRRVNSSLASGDFRGAARGSARQGGRSVDAVRRSLDRNKGSLESLYNRATRKDPSLQGRVVFELTISASGKVIRCKILSSELSDRRLGRKLVARLKMINFGREPVSVTTVTHTIDFFPA